MSTLLEVEDLDVHFGRPDAPGTVKAVDGISFKVEKGRTLGLVGESGCGKSTTGYATLQLVRPSSGRVLFDGTDLCTVNKRELRRMRRKLQIIFQDAHASLNPRMPIGDLVGEALDIHGLFRGTARAGRVRELLDMVGLSGDLFERYPHELSGGQAQRVAICRALAVEPELIICDEPVSALDVSIQAPQNREPAAGPAGASSASPTSSLSPARSLGRAAHQRPGGSHVSWQDRRDGRQGGDLHRLAKHIPTRSR